MGVKGKDLFLETQYPMKMDTQKATTDRSNAKPLAASDAPPGAPLSSEEEPGMTSIGNQSQLIV